MPQHKGGKVHKLQRSARYRASGKGKVQEARTAKNKAKHVAMNKAQGDPLAGVSKPVKPVKKGE